MRGWVGQTKQAKQNVVLRVNEVWGERRQPAPDDLGASLGFGDSC